MAMLICFGLGYCAGHYLENFGERFDAVIGTTRTAQKAKALAANDAGGRAVEMIAFEGTASPELAARLLEADAALVSVPPAGAGDPVLGAFAAALQGSARLRTIVYLSTVGVYGDRGGDWVDETSTLRPVPERSKARIAAEAAWQDLGTRMGRPVAILRLAGIYGPGRNALVNLAAGSARRIVKPGQVFNRIHVADIAQAVEACFARGANGVYNLADDEPAPPQDVIAFAAGLLGIEPPAEIPFAEAQTRMTPMAKTFYGESKRVRNAKLKAELGVTLRYPSYREGLRALFAAGDHHETVRRRG